MQCASDAFKCTRNCAIANFITKYADNSNDDTCVAIRPHSKAYFMLQVNFRFQLRESASQIIIKVCEIETNEIYGMLDK